MLRRTLFNIIGQERRLIEDQIAQEQARTRPDPRLIDALRARARELGREAEWYAEAC